MLTILIIVLLILLLTGGGYHGYRRYGHRGFGGVLGLVLIIVLIVWLLGGLHQRGLLGPWRGRKDALDDGRRAPQPTFGNVLDAGVLRAPFHDVRARRTQGVGHGAAADLVGRFQHGIGMSGQAKKQKITQPHPVGGAGRGGNGAMRFAA